MTRNLPLGSARDVEECSMFESSDHCSDGDLEFLVSIPQERCLDHAPVVPQKSCKWLGVFWLMLVGGCIVFATTSAHVRYASVAPCAKEKSRELPPPPANAPQIFVGVLTAPTNVKRRTVWRLQCGDALRAVGIEPIFFVGRPSNDARSPNDHIQGQLATEVEQKIAFDLYAEAEEHRDIEFLSYREYYRDTGDKIVQMFEKGVASGAQLIVKVDDDVCVNPKPLVDAATSRIYDVPEKMLYGGRYLFNGEEYESMKGPHHETAPFFSGPVYVLSRNLVHAILSNKAFMILHAMYGTSSEDANVGKWVQHVQKKHPEYDIEFKTFSIGYDAPST